MLLLASTDDAAFVQLAPVDTEEVVLETLRRWSHIPRRWSIDVAEDASVLGDADRLTLALDALIENAVDHTEPDDRIELAVRRDGFERGDRGRRHREAAFRPPKSTVSSAGSPGSTPAVTGRPGDSASGSRS